MKWDKKEFANLPNDALEDLIEAAKKEIDDRNNGDLIIKLSNNQVLKFLQADDKASLCVVNGTNTADIKLSYLQVAKLAESAEKMRITLANVPGNLPMPTGKKVEVSGPPAKPTVPAVPTVTKVENNAVVVEESDLDKPFRVNVNIGEKKGKSFFYATKQEAFSDSASMMTKFSLISKPKEGTVAYWENKTNPEEWVEIVKTIST